MSLALPEYSPELVALVRAVDAAEMAVRSGLWHFDDHAVHPEEPMADPESLPSWACYNLEAFQQTLPVLRSLVFQGVSAAHPGVVIEANRLGDACPPQFVLDVFEPIQDAIIRHLPSSEIAIAKLPDLSDRLKKEVGDNTLVYWDGEVYIIPQHVPSSFVEVWFRRAMGYWEDCGAYPVRLEVRSYGWQAFGIER